MKRKNEHGILSVQIADLPLMVYLAALAVAAACLFCDSLPANMVGAFFFLLVAGEGLNRLGGALPIVKTYLGGSVVCIFGGALLAYWHCIPATAMNTLSAFINNHGFLTLYICGLITGSLFNIDRRLLLRASVRLLPVALISLAAGVVCCGLLGILIGNGFWDSILYIAVAMTSGGMTAGTVPLSSIYSQVLQVPAADILNRMAPATVLGNCIAIIFAGLLKDCQKKHPSWTGCGQLVNDGIPVEKIPATPLTLEKLSGGFLISVAFYALGEILHRFFPVVPIYAFMILLVVVVKCTGLFPEQVEDAARQWGRFVIHNWTAAALFGIGITLIDLQVILSNMTWSFLVTVFVVELVITLTAAFLGKLVGFYPVESAIAAGMCTTNMGGSGNVAVLCGAERMELLPFAQIVTRSCGALMLTLGGILVRFFG
ncbi:MAG: 2-hydroxycarboxylate transporter family protein [Pygmaiobacter massiliensis]|nr:2-hydroxycarboxylate transporter family protein [Pygmaiobacter massiliensis]